METLLQSTATLLDAIDMELKVLLQNDVAVIKASIKAVLQNEKKPNDNLLP